MPTRPPRHKPLGYKRRVYSPMEDQHRGSSTARGYGRRWGKARATHLSRSPLCRYCELLGTVRPAVLVDHLYPHKGDSAVFWMTELWVSSCQACHSIFKQKVELAGQAAIDDLAHKLGLPTLHQALARRHANA